MTEILISTSASSPNNDLDRAIYEALNTSFDLKVNKNDLYRSVFNVVNAPDAIFRYKTLSKDPRYTTLCRAFEDSISERYDELIEKYDSATDSELLDKLQDALSKDFGIQAHINLGRLIVSLA